MKELFSDIFKKNLLIHLHQVRNLVSLLLKSFLEIIFGAIYNLPTATTPFYEIQPKFCPLKDLDDPRLNFSQTCHRVDIEMKNQLLKQLGKLKNFCNCIIFGGSHRSK